MPDGHGSPSKFETSALQSDKSPYSFVIFLETSKSSMLNRARRQVIPAFRERGEWKIAADYH